MVFFQLSYFKDTRLETTLAKKIQIRYAKSMNNNIFEVYVKSMNNKIFEVY